MEIENPKITFAINPAGEDSTVMIRNERCTYVARAGALQCVSFMHDTKAVCVMMGGLSLLLTYTDEDQRDRDAAKLTFFLRDGMPEHERERQREVIREHTERGTRTSCPDCAGEPKATP
jgi:hypothetical protein